MKINRLTQAIFGIALVLTAQVNAQVTIGTGDEPLKGALLELRNAPSNETSTKGLGLPRVALENLKPTSSNLLARSIGNRYGSYTLKEHIGLVVYNVKPLEFDINICKKGGAPVGPYVWTGTEWQYLGPKETLDKAKDKRILTDHGTTVVDGNTVGTFTLTYSDGVNPTENRTYYYAEFGEAGTWMTQNLATRYLPDGTLLPVVEDYEVHEPGYVVPGGKAEIEGNEGLLYSWYAAMNNEICDQGINQVQANTLESGKDPGSYEVETLSGIIQGICPDGWHLPSDREWNILERHITLNMPKYTETPLAAGTWDPAWELVGSSYDDEARGEMPDGHGKAMKSKTKVDNMETNGDSKPAEKGGFDVLLTGYTEAVINYGVAGYFWTSSRTRDPGAAHMRVFIHSHEPEKDPKVIKNIHDASYPQGVRCKKND